MDYTLDNHQIYASVPSTPIIAEYAFLILQKLQSALYILYQCHSFVYFISQQIIECIKQSFGNYHRLQYVSLQSQIGSALI